MSVTLKAEHFRDLYKYAVFKDGDYYKVRDGESLAIPYKSKSAKDALQYAFDHLTPGRTWMEPVMLFGDWILDGTVKVPDWVELIIRGRIYGEVNPLFQVHGVSDDDKVEGVKFRGGRLESNFPDVSVHGIDLKFTHNVKIEDVEFVKLDHAIHSDGSSTKSNTRLRIEGNYFVDCHDPAWLKLLSHVRVMGNTAVAPQPEPYEYGFHMDLVENFVVEGNEIHGHDIPVHVASASKGTIVGNRISGGRGGGIAITGGCYHIDVVGNEVHDMLKEGIELRRLQYGSVVGNVLHNNGYAGLRLWSDCKYVTFIGNTLSDNGYAYTPGYEHPVFAQVTILQEDGNPVAEHLKFIGNHFVNRNRTPDYQIYGAPYPGHTTKPGLIEVRGNTFGPVNTEAIHHEGPLEVADIWERIPFIGVPGIYSGTTNTTWEFSPTGTDTYFAIEMYVWKAYWRVRWDPGSAEGGIRIYNTDDGEVVTGSELVPGTAGWRTDHADVTDYFRGKVGVGVKGYGLQTKGDGSTAPSIASAVLDLYLTTNKFL